MEWTKGKPKVDGWYWVKDRFGYIDIILLESRDDEQWAWGIKSTQEINLYMIEWWYGPLLPPPQDT